MNFLRDFDPRHGCAIRVAPLVERVTAPNAGLFSFHGTNTYLVGEESVCVIDPGPDDPMHLQALIDALRGRMVTHIAITHTHVDHSPLSAKLKAATGAQTVGAGRHHAARPLFAGEVNHFAESADMLFVPDIQVGHGDRISGDRWSLSAVPTPGHCANHLAYALEGTGILFSGDHVMAWSTSIVAPPDGSMAQYMASLDTLLHRGDQIYFPGHGGPVLEPAAFVRDLKAHRIERERAILERLKAGDRKIAAIVAAIYRDVDPRLHGAAAFSVLAHVEDLLQRGEIVAEGPPSLDADYRLG